MAYTYKVWIVDGKEHFEYGNGQTRKKDSDETALFRYLVIRGFVRGHGQVDCEAV